MTDTTPKSTEKRPVPPSDPVTTREEARQRARVMRLAADLERGLRAPQEAAPDRDESEDENDR